MDINKQFELDMKEIYVRAGRECKYYPTRFLQMLSEIGGLETAKKLITKDGGTEGFLKLWEKRRLDLSVEHLVLQDKYRELFTEDERILCKNRLRDYGYVFKEETKMEKQTECDNNIGEELPVYQNVEEFLKSNTYKSINTQVQNICRFLLTLLEQKGLDFKIHPRKEGFVLWATATLKRKLNKDFLTIYTTENHLLLCPKFYGLSWKSDETNSLQRKINNTNLEKEYLELIMTAYKSVINKDSTLYQVQIDRTISSPQSKLFVDKETDDIIQDKFNYFGEVLDQKPLKAFPQMVSIDPEYVITQSRLIIEKALKLYYLKSTGRVAKENLVELINQAERDNLISPRIVNLLHTVRKSGNYTIHDGSNKSWLQEEAVIIMQAIQIILGEIVEKNRLLETKLT